MNNLTKKTFKCCICGNRFTGYGNNPCGALDSNYNVIQWKPTDRCCDECDSYYVLSGRLYMYAKGEKC